MPACLPLLRSVVIAIALAICATACVVNPVPTPDSEAASVTTGRPPPGSDASGKHNNPNGDTRALQGDAGGVQHGGTDATGSSDAGPTDAAADAAPSSDASSPD